jgi:hypothetical protein
VDYLRRGGVLQVYPEGEKFWEGRLYPGAAVLARRAGVPLNPRGPGKCPSRTSQKLIGVRILKGPGPCPAPHARPALDRACTSAHPSYPNPALPEKEDVDRMMQRARAQGISKAFTKISMASLAQFGLGRKKPNDLADLFVSVAFGEAD